MGKNILKNRNTDVYTTDHYLAKKSYFKFSSEYFDSNVKPFQVFWAEKSIQQPAKIPIAFQNYFPAAELVFYLAINWNYSLGCQRSMNV